MKLALFITLATVFPAHALDSRMGGAQCAASKAAVKNHIETIYLAEMAQYQEKAAQDSLRDVGSEVAITPFEDALSHYDRKTSRRGAKILSDLCPME